MMRSLFMGAAFASGLCMPAMAALLFGRTLRIAAPSVQGCGDIARSARRTNARTMTIRGFVNIFLGVLMVFSLEVDTDDADVLYPCVDDVRAESYEEYDHNLSYCWLVDEEESYDEDCKCGECHGESCFDGVVNAFHSGAFASFEDACAEEDVCVDGVADEHEECCDACEGEVLAEEVEDCDSDCHV